jgi:hypothetical protein
LTGHLDRVKRIRELLNETPNLHVIGNAFDGVGIPQCIRLARTTAEAMAAAVKTLLVIFCFGMFFLSSIDRSHALSFQSLEQSIDEGLTELERTHTVGRHRS